MDDSWLGATAAGGRAPVESSDAGIAEFRAFYVNWLTWGHVAAVDEPRLSSA
ncbi:MULTISPECIES: hypothetical protein [Streptomyces]|uniref:hypothetical protein n=1 Tax=Streptomyces TaxID=1883 RepID=UPI00159F1C1E|nr:MULTISPECIES: hypothetical protein [unclassified Streptomyces]WHX24489.1 hypothetical protein QFW82_40655 [Streptomyces sp. NA07423]